MRLESEQPGRVGEHRPGVGLGEADALEDLPEHPGVLAGHVGIVAGLVRGVPEVAVALDDLLGAIPG